MRLSTFVQPLVLATTAVSSSSSSSEASSSSSSSAAAAVAEAAIDKADYLARYAPIQLARLSSLRALYNASLSPLQSSFLLRAEAAVSTFNQSELEPLSALCDIAFAPDDCRELARRGDDHPDDVDDNSSIRSSISSSSNVRMALKKKKKGKKKKEKPWPEGWEDEDENKGPYEEQPPRKPIEEQDPVIRKNCECSARNFRLCLTCVQGLNDCIFHKSKCLLLLFSSFFPLSLYLSLSLSLTFFLLAFGWLFGWRGDKKPRRSKSVELCSWGRGTGGEAKEKLRIVVIHANMAQQKIVGCGPFWLKACDGGCADANGSGPSYGY